jgi:23S rRNA G2445 N2-methylase RlmL
MPPYPLPDGRSLFVINPPFGKRIASGRESLKLYRRIGNTMRSAYRGCHYAIIVPGREHEKALNLPAHKKIPFNFGGINVTLEIGCVW